MKLTFLTIVISVLSWIAVNAQDASGELARLTDFYKQKLKDKPVVGSAVWVIKNGMVVHEQYHGLKDKEEKQKVNRNSIYRWNSLVKTFAGIAIMQLRDRGLLKLEDTVAHYIPELMNLDTPFGTGEAVTIKHLLTHSSGLPKTIPMLEKGPYPTLWDSLASALSELEVGFKPGSKYGYSSLNILLLKRIVEVVSREDFEYYIEKNVFKPLGMFNSYFDEAPRHLLNNVCLNYQLSDEGAPIAFDPDTTALALEGSFSSSLPDMAWYLNFLLGNANKQLYDLVLKRESIQEMLEPYVQIPDKQQMGLTFSMENVRGVRLYGHDTQPNGFNTQIYFDTKSNTAYLIANNTVGGAGRGFDKQLKDNIVRNYFLKKE